MRKYLLLGSITAMVAMCFYFTTSKKIIASQDVVLHGESQSEEEHDGYDEAAARDQFEFDRMKDPALGYIPMDRMLKAVDYSETLKQNQRLNSRNASTLANLTWTERGPIYDLVGASGNSRGPGTNYTAGRIAAVLIDTLNDPTGNTVFCGGIAGGIWKCTNFLSAIPNWQKNDDRFDNLAISSICQDPSTPATMYFSTGEATSNADAVYGGGVWKSTNSGTTWTKLSATTSFLRCFKIVCDGAGNIYLANRTTTSPASNASGLYRSKDGGASWQVITPSVRTSGNAIPTDIEISSTGRLHASFGYSASTVQHQYTDDAANVTPTVGWNTSTGIRINTAVVANRLELATVGNVLYAVTINSSNNVDSSYKSIDGGVTWTKQNTAAYTTGITNTQGWYDLTLAINPSNTNEFLVGGLDAYKSINSGLTVTRQTFWVSTAPYVHADHHFMQWWKAGTESRVVIGGDGGLFYSNDAAVTFSDKNRNLAIKQFYDAAIHPAAGSPYLLAGAQDNGVHALTNPGLSFSTEVYGGDGCFVHINQQNPQIQFGSYVYNTYRRSTDGGASWSSFTFGSNGLFVNPFDYDDGQNIMYASNGVQGASNNQILRWPDANTSAVTTVLTLSALTRGSASNATTFKVSPFTTNSVYIGGSSGKLLRLNNANTVTSATVDANVTDITGASFPNANLSCVNVGSSDNTLVAVFSNYGVGHVYYSTDGGTSWTNVDGIPGSGGLPDMPVRWALIDPQNNSRIFLATEAGVYSTDAVNGASTVWNADTNFPTVRTDVLKMRLSDNTVVAATHGRGLFTAVIPALPEIRFAAPSQTIAEATTGTTGCRGYTDYSVNVSAVAAPTGDATVTYNVKAGNTAIEGIDFDYTSNGSFATPSKQQTFSSGATATKAIAIRVYDDAAIEADETFTLSFSVAGTTDAFAGTFNNYVVTIKDNDFAPVASTIGTATVGSGNYGGYVQPLRGTNAKSKSQFLYLASELSAAGISPGNITSLGLRILSKGSTIPYTGFTVSLKATNITVLGSDFETGLTPYYSANYTSSVGTNTFTFSTPFNWDGTSNVVVMFCYDNVAGSGTADDNVSMNSTSDTKGIWARVNTGAISGCSLASANTTVFSSAAGTFIRPDITLNGVLTNNPVETVLNASKSSYLSPNDDVPFYNTNGNIIARIKNLSASNYACTQISVDRAGNGAQPFWNNNPANYVTTKSLQVVPTTNNPSGQYQITLYYTAAEKAAWETATGQNWNTIQIVKVKSQIKNYSPSTPFPDGPGAVETVTPTFGTFGADYTLTATFSSGFSGFAAGNIGFPLPVTLLDFTGRLENNSVVLNWSTSTEQNSKNFDVEKSTDGVNFYNIGSVNAAGNSSTRKDYGLRDDKLSPVNYYRLRMNDLDGHNKLSNVVVIRYDVKAQNVWVIKNPFSSAIELRLAKEATQVRLQLVDAKGALVAEKMIAKPSGLIHWDMTNNISAGSYILRTVVDGKTFTHKLIKQ